MNPLLMITQPREIPEFLEAANKLDIDKLWIKFYGQDEAYKEGRDRFLKMKEYTHLVILPDDLIVTQNDLDILASHNHRYIVSGYANNTSGKTDNVYSNISYSLPPDKPQSGLFDEYHFLTLRELESMGNLIQVKFSGFAIPFIPRWIVDLIPFRTAFGCCNDSCMSLDLDFYRIPQYVDTRVKTRHIRTDPSIIQVGKKPKEIVYDGRA